MNWFYSVWTFSWVFYFFFVQLFESWSYTYFKSIDFLQYFFLNLNTFESNQKLIIKIKGSNP